MKYDDCLYCRPMPRVRRQRGAVLVFAMVVLMLVASLAVTMASQLELSARQGGNRLHGGQARAYLMGAESLGMAVLARDSRTSSGVDHLGEDWARSVPEFPVDGGWVRASLEDAQGRLNINAMAYKVRNNSAAGGEAARFTPEQRRFIRLLQTSEELRLSLPEAIAIAEAVIDWLDSDDEVTGFGGAEQEFYLRQQQPYRAANALLVDVSELRLVRYITPEMFQYLRSFVVALPETAALNINSAPVPVLQTINRQNELLPMDRYAAQRLAAWRDEGKPFASIDRFLQSEHIGTLTVGKVGVSSMGLAVNSDYFVLRAESEIIGRYRSQASLIQRNAAGGRVVRRGSL